MRTSNVVLAAVIASGLLVSASAAQPYLHYTWGPADGLIVNQDFTGPTTYTQTISVTGLFGTVSRIKVKVTYGTYSGPGSAWHAIQPPLFQSVSAPQPDCEGDPGFDVSTVVAGAEPIPNATQVTEVHCSQSPTGGPRRCSILITLTINPPLVADGATRYGIATLSYHHQNSVVGQAPDACDFAETPRCFRLGDPDQNLVYALINDFRIPLHNDGGLLSWQHPLMNSTCWYVATSASRSSWGSIKTLYR